MGVKASQMTGYLSDRMEKEIVQPVDVDAEEALAIAERPVRMDKCAWRLLF